MRGEFFFFFFWDLGAWARTEKICDIEIVNQ